MYEITQKTRPGTLVKKKTRKSRQNAYTEKTILFIVRKKI